MRLEARRRAIVPCRMADRSSLRNFLSFASAVAKSVALAALSFSTCDFVRLNTRHPFIAFLYRYLLSVRANVRSAGRGSSVGGPGESPQSRAFSGESHSGEDVDPALHQARMERAEIEDPAGALEANGLNLAVRERPRFDEPGANRSPGVRIG